MKRVNKETVYQFIKFWIIWVTWVWIHLIITYFLTDLIWLYYIISYYIWQFFWMTNNFMLNRYFTFSSNKWKLHKQYLSSLLFYTLTALISWWLVYILTEYLHIRYIFSTVLSISLIFVINFALHKYIVFKK